MMMPMRWKASPQCMPSSVAARPELEIVANPFGRWKLPPIHSLPLICSKTSSSPQAGQLPVPIVQNAGHVPCCFVSLARISQRPYLNWTLPLLVIEPDVKDLP